MANPLCFIDHIDNLSLIERNGVVRSLTRKARCIYQNVADIPPDYSVLNGALAVCPTFLSILDLPGFPSLVLVERNAALAEKDIGCVDVILKYDHILDGPNQELQEPTNGLIYGRGRASITQKTTNFFYPNGIPSNGKVLLLVSHTFEPWDTGIPGMPINPDTPRTVVQTGEISIPFPQANFTMTGVISTINPWSIANQFVASINKVVWLNKPALTWICSEVKWEVLDLSGTPTYKFEFEFQYNVDGWDAVVVFNDQRTGRPPAGVDIEAGTNTNPDAEKPDAKAGVLNYRVCPTAGGSGSSPVTLVPAGYWPVPALPRNDFNELFKSLFEGDFAAGIV